MSRILSFLIDEPPLTVSPSLARVLGLNCAMLVQQLHYWLEHKRRDPHAYQEPPHFFDGRLWIFWTQAEMLDRVPLGSTTDPIKLAVSKLKRQGILLAASNPVDKWDKRGFYSLDYERLQAVFDENYSQESSKSLILSIGGKATNRSVEKPPIDGRESHRSMGGKATVHKSERSTKKSTERGRAQARTHTELAHEIEQQIFERALRSVQQIGGGVADADVQQHARPGESWDAARRRLLRERGG